VLSVKTVFHISKVIHPVNAWNILFQLSYIPWLTFILILFPNGVNRSCPSIKSLEKYTELTIKFSMKSIKKKISINILFFRSDFSYLVVSYQYRILKQSKKRSYRDGSREQCGLTQYLSVIQKLHSFLCTSMVIAVSIKKNFRSVGCRRSKSSFRHYLCCPVSHERTNLA
jgi:hypothetical protein